MLKEETWNALTHGIGTALSLSGVAVLVYLAAVHGDAWHIIGCSVYGTTLVLLFLSSTLYHLFYTPGLKHFLRILDHASIFLLIAGTYTPFTLVTLRGAWGWSLFGVIWGLALMGIVFQLFFVNRYRIIQVLIYIAMGWLIIIAIKPLIDHLPKPGLAWLVTGGLSYTFGVIFYIWKKLPYNHAIWHLFVLAGSICHYFSILFYVIP